MSTIGYLMVFIAFILVRSIYKGRVENLPQDISDTFTAIFTGNAALLKEVSSRTGGGLEADTNLDGSSDGTTYSNTSSVPGQNLVQEMERLGDTAKGYRLGYTGPSYYDCSGLVWRAMKNLNIYNGIRFTTHTFTVQCSSIVSQVVSPAVGDIVLWQNRHMGVVTGNDVFYSALSSKSGIRTLAISALTKQNKINPTYWRLIGAKGTDSGGTTATGQHSVVDGGRY